MEQQQHQRLVEELHKPARRNYPRRKFNVRGLDETWQADLVEMQPYARENRGIKYLLTVIDVLSKFAWAVPVKRKTAQDVTAAMDSVLQQGRVPSNLQTDKGKEFYNASFQNLMSRYHINHYSTYSNLKASIVERFNRTLKNRMWLKFSLRGTYKWLDILQDLVAAYNDTKHRTIGMKPKDVNAANVETLMQRFSQNNRRRRKVPKFKIGDKVRVSKNKHVFEKGYTPNWTTEIFTVNRVMPTSPVTYKLKDYQDKPIAGGFYEEELLETKYPDVYLVEKVLKKRGDRAYVKWLGFDSSHNSWIDKSDL